VPIKFLSDADDVQAPNTVVNSVYRVSSAICFQFYRVI